MCPSFAATGRDSPGGYAEFMVVDEHFAYRISAGFTDEQVAPLLRAGAIGFRSLRLSQMQDGQRLGLTGFGASGHLVLQMARYCYPSSEIYVFARNPAERRFALRLGAVWSGDTKDRAPDKLDARIDITPAWEPIVQALGNLESGGRLVINAIRKEAGQESLLALDYPAHLWLEKEIKSVASDVDGDLLTYAWTWLQRPDNSAAVLSDATAVFPQFVADQAGTYQIQLIVNDGSLDSHADTVVISTDNVPPVAQAGED